MVNKIEQVQGKARDVVKAITGERGLISNFFVKDTAVVDRADQLTRDSAVELLTQSLAPRLNEPAAIVDERLFTRIAEKSKTVKMPQPEERSFKGSFHFTVEPSNRATNEDYSTYAFENGRLKHKQNIQKLGEDLVKTDVIYDYDLSNGKLISMTERIIVNNKTTSEDKWQYLKLKNGKFAYVRMAKNFTETDQDRINVVPNSKMVTILPEAAFGRGKLQKSDLYLGRDQFIQKILMLKDKHPKLLLEESDLDNKLIPSDSMSY